MPKRRERAAENPSSDEARPLDASPSPGVLSAGGPGRRDSAALRADAAGRQPPVGLARAAVAGHLAHARDQTAQVRPQVAPEGLRADELELFPGTRRRFACGAGTTRVDKNYIKNLDFDCSAR